MDSLEREQSKTVEQQRSNAEGNDAELTELAVPQPAPENDDLRDTYEKEEDKARKKTTTNQDAADDQDADDQDVYLTEVAVPAPVAEDTVGEEDGAGDSTDRLQQEGFASSHELSESQLETEKPSGSKRTVHIFTEICTISWLIFFAILGTLARLGVQAISTYPNAVFPSTVLWANMGGSLFLGFLLEDRRLFSYTVVTTTETEDLKGKIDKSKKILPLYIGLATGFCGSFTSFSTFITDTCLALANKLPSPSLTSPYHTIAQQTIHSRPGGYSFMATVGIIIVHVAVSIAGLQSGAHVAVALEPVVPCLSAKLIHRILDPLSIPLGWGAWLGAVLLTIWPPQNDWRHRVTLALVFAPPGVLLRYYLSRLLNARIDSFPLGTFIANISGTIIEGLCMDLQHSSTIKTAVPGMKSVPCAVLQGVMFGFCGCATTVSTWVAELNGLRRRHAWMYGLASVAVALSFQVVIMGSLAWTVGFEPRC